MRAKDDRIDFVPKAQKSLGWQISDLDEKIRGIEMKYGGSNSKLPGLRKKLKALRTEYHAQAHKATDIALIPEADGAEFIKPTDGAQEAFKGWSTAKAQDGILSSPFMALAALLAILNHFNKETVGPQDYDLTTYRPKKKEW